jgi:hypothetical protein
VKMDSWTANGLVFDLGWGAATKIQNLQNS